MPESHYRLVVFDWDGTLLDSIATIVGCTQATLAALELPPANEEDIRSAIGLGIRETVESFCPGCDEATFGKIVEVYRELWFGHFANEPVLFEGVSDLLAALVNEGRLLAIATAKSRRGLATDLERTQLDGFFETSRTVDEAAGKPKPDMLLDILDELDVPAGAALMVGDSVHDLQMANNAGVAAVAVASGTTAREVLLEDDPLECLDSVAGLHGWLRRSRSGPTPLSLRASSR